jgi:hypothetical protein
MKQLSDCTQNRVKIAMFGRFLCAFVDKYSVGGPLRCDGPFCCGALDCRIECQDRARLVVDF